MKAAKIVKIILCVVLLCFFTSCRKKETVILSESKSVQSEEITDAATKEGQLGADVEVCVHVCGAVLKPGVYVLKKDSRTIDAIEMAGGFKENASRDYVNLAKTVEDEEKIYIPTLEEANNTALCENPSKKKININQATVEELKTLEGVGDSKANSIIEYREKYGKFKKIEDIMKISGIKKAMYQKIKDRISVD